VPRHIADALDVGHRSAAEFHHKASQNLIPSRRRWFTKLRKRRRKIARI
jgi:hypothetical protein